MLTFVFPSEISQLLDGLRSNLVCIVKFFVKVGVIQPHHQLKFELIEYFGYLCNSLVFFTMSITELPAWL